MKMEFYQRPRSPWAMIAAVAALLAAGANVRGDTKTVMFGWEDGTSGALATFANSPDTLSVTPSNVASGEVIDYGPDGNPFDPPVTHEVAPFEGTRMLQTQLEIGSIDSGSDGSATIAWVANLDPGDTLEFSFYGWDPPGATDRSPSVFPNSIYTNSSDLGSFDGFSVPLQPFANFVGGNGWEELFLDADGIDGAEIVKTIVFDPAGDLAPTQGSGSNSGTADAIQLDAGFFYQSLTATEPVGNGDGTEELYIDLATIKVTSSNPDAVIILPDGSMTMVNEVVGLPGDYNGDGWVDAADYTTWRDHLGEGDETALNGNGDGMNGVDAGDYTRWVENFGTHAEGSGSLGASGVPEPASAALAVIGLFGCGFLRRRPRR